METNQKPRLPQSWLALHRLCQSELAALRGRYRSWQALKDESLGLLGAMVLVEDTKPGHTLADEGRRIADELKSACKRAEIEYREKLSSVRRLHHKLSLL